MKTSDHLDRVKLLHNVPGAVRGAVVNNDDLLFNWQLDPVDSLKEGLDGRFLVENRNDHRKLHDMNPDPLRLK